MSPTLPATDRSPRPLAGPAELAAELESASAENALLLLFSATWCAPCQRLHPELVRYAAEAPPAVRVLTVDVDEQPAIAARYGVDAFPTLLLFAHGEAVLRTTEPRTCERLHEAIDGIADRARSGPPRAAYPLGEAPQAGPRTVPLPRSACAGFSFSAYPTPGEQREAITVGTDATAGQPWQVSVPAGWRTVARIRDEQTGAGAAAVLAELGEHDLDDLVLVLDGVPDQIITGLRRFVTLRRLRVESPALVGRPLTAFAALTGLHTLDLNTMGATLGPAQLQQLRVLLPDTIVNGTWTAPHLRPPSGSEA